MRTRRTIALTTLLLLSGMAPSALAEDLRPPCRPCAGLRVEDPRGIADLLAAPPRLGDEDRFFVVWDVEPGRPGEQPAPPGLVAAGGVPWMTFVFRASTPLQEHLGELEGELRATAELVAASHGTTHFGVAWRPREGTASPEEFAFLLKRASVAITGANVDARVIAGPLPPDAERLAALYGEEVAAYLDGIALTPGPAPEALRAALETLERLDPGKPITLDGEEVSPDRPFDTLAVAARRATEGISVTLFRWDAAAPAPILPLKLLAREFHGDLSYDPYSVPDGAPHAWTFVRGEDLGLRVIFERAPDTPDTTLEFSDTLLKNPALVLADSGEALPLAGVRRTRSGVRITVPEPAPVAVLRLDRTLASEAEGGLEEAVVVKSERQMPVEEILRRLQTFEDAQDRKLDHYQATNTMHLRFQLGGTQYVEATFRGPFFFRRGAGFDWAWEEFYLNGVRWRGKKIPEIPLVQPEKAAALPLQIHFSREYRYRLRGTETVRGHDCWVIDFTPAQGGATGHLYKGTVWVDREIYARVRTRALQLGLEGEVISNEETIDYEPLTASGEPAEWTPASYWLPTHTVSNQVFSILNGTSLIERESRLEGLELNGADFAVRRDAVMASESTMVRDTESGLRYLVKDKETGEREVQEGYRTTRIFAAGGIFIDDALDFPLPLGGVNYFSFDFKGTGNQVDVFFAGALLTADLADPDLFGSKFDAGVSLFAFGVPLTDTLFRDGREVTAEEVKRRPARLTLTLGRPLGSYAKLNLQYVLSYSDFQEGDRPAADFVLPVDHFTHTFRLSARYNRSGFRLRLDGSYNQRTRWEAWGRPGNPGFDPEAKDYLRWQGRLAKSWYLPRFQRIGAEVEYVDGQDLDRFSKYGFGFFSDTRVHGYSSDRVRAERAALLHLSYGFEIGEVFRLDLVGDVASATDRAAGLEDEILGGAGIVGTFIGPWQTVVNLDLGFGVAGPDDGFVLFLTFLKLFG